MATPLPAGFRAHVANVGIKDETDDFVVIVADRPCAAAAVFTRSRFAGPSVVLSRANVADGALRAYVVVSKNANVATGAQGLDDARQVVRGVAHAYDLHETDVLIASTGVIGRRYPMDRVRAHLASLPSPLPLAEVEPAAIGIMTTDTFPKVASTTVDGVTIVGFAKGVGMIEPDMATLIALFMTDAAVDAAGSRRDVPPSHRSHPERGERRHRHLHERHRCDHGERGGGIRRRSPGSKPGCTRWRSHSLA